jgi:hypothetical protein
MKNWDKLQQRSQLSGVRLNVIMPNVVAPSIAFCFEMGPQGVIGPQITAAFVSNASKRKRKKKHFELETKY